MNKMVHFCTLYTRAEFEVVDVRSQILKLGIVLGVFAYIFTWARKKEKEK